MTSYSSYRREPYPLADPDYRSEEDGLDYDDVSDRLDHVDTKIDDKVIETIGKIFHLTDEPVIAVARTNITLEGEQTVDNTPLVTDDLVLVTAQTEGTDNGIYQVNDDAWTRWPGADVEAELGPGTTVIVDGSLSDHDGEYWLQLSQIEDIDVDVQLWTSVYNLTPILSMLISGLLRYEKAGEGSPEGVITAPPGATYRNLEGGSGTSFWVKETGEGNTGWAALLTT